MLTHLSIQNVVLIKSLHLTMQSGLTALTGETGAGKSILLDSLGLVLGARAESGLLRKNADQAIVTAQFDLPENHAVYQVLKQQDFDANGELIIRRTLTADGRSKAFINDQPVSVGLLGEVGALLVDIHGQFETHGLLDSKKHGALLDGFGDYHTDISTVQNAWKNWKSVQKKLIEHEENLLKAKQDEEYLTACVAELKKINPQKGEEDILLEKRQRLQHFEAIMSGLNEAFQALENDKGANDSVYRALRTLEKIADKAEDKIDPLIKRLDANLSSLRDIAGDIEMMGNTLGEDENIEFVDDRLHELRAAARKHNVLCDDLPDVLENMQTALSRIHNDDKLSAKLKIELSQAENEYFQVAKILSEKRTEAASLLTAKIMAELPDLKLGNAQFRVNVSVSQNPHQNGLDDVCFLIKTNPGSPEGELGKVASGGELSRILLALKVVLSKTSPVPVMVFDEIDSGIGGATADAVGQRLSRMSKACQILVVTHSPQVAAKADHHWIVSKSDQLDNTTETSVSIIIDETARIDEIARMVSGALLTDEARAAARVLRNAA